MRVTSVSLLCSETVEELQATSMRLRYIVAKNVSAFSSSLIFLGRVQAVPIKFIVKWSW